MYNRGVRRYRLKTKGVNWSGILGLLTALAVVALGAWFWQNSVTSTPGITSDQGRPSLATTTPQVPTSTKPVAIDPSGSYRPYTSAQFANLPADAKVVLFFTADDCGQCTKTDIALSETADGIPAKVFIYKVQYGEAVELQKRYDVTAPHTFVQIDTLGNPVQHWRGSVDLESILARIK
jgi:hypothetical protein